MHGYSTCGTYATAVLEGMTIYETMFGEKTALVSELVESRFSRLDEAALTAKYLVALASNVEFSELQRHGGLTFSYREEELLADRVSDVK